MYAMRTLLVALALLASTSCSSDTDEKAEASKPLPTVSASTTCGQLFDGKAAPMEGVVDLMQKDASAQDDTTAREFADALEGIGKQAGDELAPHVGVVVGELRTFADAVESGGDFQTGTMVTSLTELNNVCGVTPRF